MFFGFYHLWFAIKQEDVGKYLAILQAWFKPGLYLLLVWNRFRYHSMCWYLSAERLYCSQKFDYISMDLIKILFNLHQSTSSTHVVWTFGFVVQPGTRQTCDKVIKTKLSCNQPWVKIRNIDDKFISIQTGRNSGNGNLLLLNKL